MNFYGAVAGRQHFGVVSNRFVLSWSGGRRDQSPQLFHSSQFTSFKRLLSVASSSATDATESSPSSAENPGKPVPIRRLFGKEQKSPGKKLQGLRVAFPLVQKASAADGASAKVFAAAAWYRDACNCHRCVDPSTKQKLFQSSDIPPNLRVSKERVDSDGNLSLTWENDLPGFDTDHISHYSANFLSSYRGYGRAKLETVGSQYPEVKWNKSIISETVKFLDYSDYMTSDIVLYDAIKQLRLFGLVFIRGVPHSSTAVESVGGRIGNLRDTLYGRTWDVKSVPDAKNIAYTSKFLGFHMDLLYMTDPPGFQLLHCLANSCEGGNSMFSDSFNAVRELEMEDKGLLKVIKNFKTVFHYKNAGHHYRYSRKLIEWRDSGAEAKLSAEGLYCVNWSPPFQAPYTDMIDTGFDKYLGGLRAFGRRIEAPENIYEYRLKEGECVIFNNRRVLHARRAFDVNSGERWLKGAYVDTDVLMSRYRVLRESLGSSQDP